MAQTGNLLHKLLSAGEQGRPQQSMVGLCSKQELGQRLEIEATRPQLFSKADSCRQSDSVVLALYFDIPLSVGRPYLFSPKNGRIDREHLRDPKMDDGTVCAVWHANRATDAQGPLIRAPRRLEHSGYEFYKAD